MIKPGPKPDGFQLCGKPMSNGRTCGRAAGHRSNCRSRESMDQCADRQMERYQTEPEYRKRVLAAQQRVRAARREGA